MLDEFVLIQRHTPHNVRLFNPGKNCPKCVRRDNGFCETMDPYDVLMLDRRDACTLRDLHNNYYRLAAQLHPSRCKLPRKEAKEVMQLLERSFEKVETDLRKHRHPDSVRDVACASSEKAREASKKFDMARFNQVYESLRAPSVYDKGYQEWMRQTSGEEDGPKACDE